jgi:opacity protein-like surface antigen|tara:strand:- start:4470 stop:4913 length:444 start_codon:yes stop_codon:yes gene_type:complete
LKANSTTMKFTTVATALLATGASAAAIPEPAASTTLQARQETGSYTIAGLGQRKQQVTAAGANSFNLAIAMLETEKMDTNYAYGDNKQNDSANFGIFKQNWGLLRECCSKFKGQSQSQWNNGAALKYDPHVFCILHIADYSAPAAPT